MIREIIGEAIADTFHTYPEKFDGDWDEPHNNPGKLDTDEKPMGESLNEDADMGGVIDLIQQAEDSCNAALGSAQEAFRQAVASSQHSKDGYENAVQLKKAIKELRDAIEILKSI